LKEPLHISESVVTLFASAPLAKALAAAVAAVVAFFFPSQVLRDLALGSFVFICLDTLTGVMASYSGGVPISSAKFSRLLTKLVGYSVVIVVTTFAAKLLPQFGELAPAASAAVLSVVVVTEGLSILENLDKMGLKLPAFVSNAFKAQQDRQ